MIPLSVRSVRVCARSVEADKCTFQVLTLFVHTVTFAHIHDKNDLCVLHESDKNARKHFDHHKRQTPHAHTSRNENKQANKIDRRVFLALK